MFTCGLGSRSLRQEEDRGMHRSGGGMPLGEKIGQIRRECPPLRAAEG